MGVFATRSGPPEQRGAAVGNFIAFADVALAVTGPALGLVTQRAGLPSAFSSAVPRPARPCASCSPSGPAAPPDL